MVQPRELTDSPFDLGLSLCFSIVAVVVAVVSVPAVVSVTVGLTFLLFVPGYTVTVALFPGKIQWNGTGDGSDGLFPFDRLVLSVVVSIALAIIVGVNIEFTPLSISAPTVVGGLSIVTLIAVIVGAVRRSRVEERNATAWTAARSKRSGGSLLAGDHRTLATLMVVMAVGVSLVSVAVVAGTVERGEQYTEFGLLSENESGSLVATGHPSEMTVEDATPLYYTITNREQRTETYYIVVQLQEVAPNGTVTRSERITGFRETVDAEETIQQGHTITPTFTGDDLRVQYLLYTSQPPEEPGESNAYDHLHIWVDVTA